MTYAKSLNTVLAWHTAPTKGPTVKRNKQKILPIHGKCQVCSDQSLAWVGAPTEDGKEKSSGAFSLSGWVQESDALEVNFAFMSFQPLIKDSTQSIQYTR